MSKLEKKYIKTDDELIYNNFLYSVHIGNVDNSTKCLQVGSSL